MMNAKYKITDWLPVTKKEAELRGWDSVDVILLSGDAYVDHPSFGSSMIARLIESRGYRVAIVPQPNWRDDLRDFKKFGRPELFFAVTSGCMDSMINHYTAAKRLRSDDAYTPGGKSGFRPDRALTVYSRILKDLYPDVPVIAGGIEASLRRLTHYDYWNDSLMPSILHGSGIDLLVYGMGEKPVLDILQLMQRGVPFNSLKTVLQTAYTVPERSLIPKNKKWIDVELHSFEECLTDRKKFGENFILAERHSVSIEPVRLIEKADDSYIVINPRHLIVKGENADWGYDLPYTRLPHPKYKDNRIPAYEMIRHSVTIHRGCFGGCSFCAITSHQGKRVVSRSERSVTDELESVVMMPDFKGYVSDMGGPTANMYGMGGDDESLCEKCSRPSCIYPSICTNLDYNHASLLELYHKAESIKGIKKIFISSGIRYDLLLSGDAKKQNLYLCREYLNKVVRDHVSGRLKTAPEHTSAKVLKVMRKPPYNLFLKFKKIFEEISSAAGLNQQVVPYFISSHPGCDLNDMAELAAEVRGSGIKPEQVQDFTPSPMTLSSVIYYTGADPYTGQKIYCAKKMTDKREQKSFFFWHKNEERGNIRKILRKIGRQDLEKKILG